MKNVTKIAKKSAGLSQKCSICPLMQRCTLEIHRACFDSFVEGFKKGARAAEKEINKKFASEKKCIDFRNWLKEVHGEVFEIGAGEFKESGTTVSTMAVVIKK